MDLIFKFYGTDWAAFIFALIHVYLLGNKKKSGFIYGALSNLCWTTYAFITMSIAQILANVVFAIMNLRGFYKWYKAGIDE